MTVMMYLLESAFYSTAGFIFGWMASWSLRDAL